MTTKRMTLLLLFAGGLLLFSGLDMKKSGSDLNSADASWGSKIPVLFPAKDKSQQKILYGSLLLAAGGIFFLTSKKEKGQMSGKSR